MSTPPPLDAEHIGVCRVCQLSLVLEGDVWVHNLDGIPNDTPQYKEWLKAIPVSHEAEPMTDDEIGAWVIEAGIANPMPEDEHIHLLEKIITKMSTAHPESIKVEGTPREIAEGIVKKGRKS